MSRRKTSKPKQIEAPAKLDLAEHAHRKFASRVIEVPKTA